MSTHGQRRHPAGVGGVRIRSTHYSKPQVWAPEVQGVSVAESRSGEAIQQPDIGPQIIDGGIHVVPGTIDISLFASGIIPPRVVDALPSLPDADYAEGSLVFLTTDGKLYRNYGDAWTVAVDGADIIANSITAGQIAAGAIGVDELAAGAIETQHFSATAKAPEVENADSSVQITPTGIVINNGAIVLRDDAGESVLSAAGFAGSWLDFLKTNVYNGTFSSGIGRSVPTPSMEEITAAGDLPYWDIYRDAGATTSNSHLYHGSASDADGVMELRLAATDLPAGAQVGIEQVVPLSAVIGRRGTGSTGLGVRVVTEPITATGTLYYVTTEVTPMGLSGVNLTPVDLATPTTGSAGLTAGAESQVSISALPELTTHLRIRVYLQRISVTVAGDVEVAIRNVSIVPGVAEVWLQGTGHDAAARIRTANGGASNAQLYLDPAVAYPDSDKSVLVFGTLILGGSQPDIFLSRGSAVESGADNLPAMVLSGGVLQIAAVGSANEGGQIELLGEGTDTDWAIDNFDGRVRMHAGGGEYFMLRAEGWQTPTLLNSWANFGGNYPTAQYRRDALGFVHFKGLITKDTAGTSVVFNLPAGFRPPGTAGGHYHFPISSNGGWASLRVNPNGDVDIIITSPGWHSLDGVHFYAGFV